MMIKKFIFSLLFFIVSVFVFYVSLHNFLICNVSSDTINKDNLEIDNVSNHYNEFVKTSKLTNLYDKDYNLVGKIGKDVELTLETISNFDNVKYFEIKDFDDKYFIKYMDVEPIDKIDEYDLRYKNYIVFNENVSTSNKTSLYDSLGNLVYEFNESYSFAVIIKEEDKYGVEFNNRLLYIKNDDSVNIYENNNTSLENSSGVPVLNYHFVYEDGDDSCNEEICHSSSQIKEHFSYIKDNGFFTPTMNELEMYIDGKIRLPQKSVVITFDDGAMAENAKKYVDMYELNATLFLITSWFSKDQFESEYFEIHSHGDNLHNTNECPGGQGGAIKCWDREKLLSDLKSSREKLNNTTVFAYPFYEYNDYSIEVLKEAGFTMAFAGEYANGQIKATVSCNKFKIPRWTIVNWTTHDTFVSYVNGGR